MWLLIGHPVTVVQTLLCSNFVSTHLRASSSLPQLRGRRFQDCTQHRKTPSASIILNRFPIVLGVDGPITISSDLKLSYFLWISSAVDLLNYFNGKYSARCKKQVGRGLSYGRLLGRPETILNVKIDHLW